MSDENTRYQIIGKTVLMEDYGRDLCRLADDFKAKGYQVVFPNLFVPQRRSGNERSEKISKKAEVK